ncbi:MAG: D-lyxose/D-mannose family sugar isomerase [Victivallaceae bacterium]|nr:D-lyxose/D-mannose family sugar isomerase [Victivallaceae bacterium]
MKRSEINCYINDAIEFFNEQRFYLPAWAFYTPQDWQTIDPSHREIMDNMLGWDLTDFGSGAFLKTGLLLFTLRNGNPKYDTKPYAEKIMVVRENQLTPMHFHSSKMEDIINRGGGNLVIEIQGSTPQGEFSTENVALKVDGVSRLVKPGGKVVLTPGESICLEQGIYHSFWGEQGKGKVLVGEVSMVNDDTADNHFYEKQGRFSQVIEDEPSKHLLAVDYID